MPSFDLFNPTDTHRAVREAVHHFGETLLEPQAAEHDETETFNEGLFRRLGRELNLFGLTVPEEAGGVGLDPVATVIACEELSRYDPGFALSYLAHEVLFVNNFYHNANPAQRARFLPDVLSGARIAGMAMTEPGAGTDVLGMRTTARRRGDRYFLTGTKQFATNGPVGDLFLVYAKMDDPGRREVSSFVVERTAPGFSVGKKEKKMGMRASPTSQLVLEECEIPVENRLGAENGALVHMMRNLEIERVTLAAQSVGIALRSLEVMCRYAVSERKAFGKALIQFGQIQQRVAEAYARTHAARALVYQVAHAIDPDRRESLGADAAKLVATPVAEEVARSAIQVLGGYGYTRDYPVERLLRDAILLSIGGGTIEAMQKNIAAELIRQYR
ncbi:MAG: acyl-CoA dehydrogenase family protein [Deltaproteobacteria bacterium]|nr:acyl-CoA dehydrogenase family protein [Deltaproteobacteria bacterium]